MPAQSRAFGALALLLATGSWGGLFLASRPALADLDPSWFTLIRYSLAALVFVLLLAPRGAAPWRRLRRDGVALAMRGLAGFGVFGVLLLGGLTRSLPTHGAIIIATVPITTQFWRWAVDGVRPARVTLISALLALAGVLVVSGLLQSPAHALPGVAPSGPYWQGDAMMLLATLGWVWYTRGTARFAELDAIEYTGLTILAAWPLLLLVALVASGMGWARLPDPARVWVWWPQLLYVGLVASAAGVLAYNHGVRLLGAVTASAFNNFVPVSALLISLALGHPPAVHELLGMAMVVAALLMHVLGQRNAVRPAEPHCSPAPGCPFAALPQLNGTR